MINNMGIGDWAQSPIPIIVIFLSKLMIKLNKSLIFQEINELNK